MTAPHLVRLTLALALVAQGCRSTEQESASNHDAQVREAMDHFLVALNNLDLVAIDSMFTDSVSAFVPTVQGHAVQGRTAMREIFVGYAARFPDGPPPATVPQKVVVSSSDSLGVVSFVVPDLERGIVRRRTFVFRRGDGGWRISHYHASDFLSAPPTR